MGGPAGSNHLHPHFCQTWKDTEDLTTCELLFKSLIHISSLVPENVEDLRFSFLLPLSFFLPLSSFFSSRFHFFSLSLPLLPSLSLPPSLPPQQNTLIPLMLAPPIACPVPLLLPPQEGSSSAVALRTFFRENLSKQLQFFFREQGGMKGWSYPATHILIIIIPSHVKNMRNLNLKLNLTLYT